MRTFQQAADDYKNWAQQYRDASLDMAGARQDLDIAKGALAERESALMMDGAALGKNAEERKAALTLACADDKRYQALEDDYRDCQKQMAICEANRDDAANGMSLARREMDYAIAQTELTAAIEAGRGLERVSR